MAMKWALPLYFTTGHARLCSGRDSALHACTSNSNLLDCTDASDIFRRSLQLQLTSPPNSMAPRSAFALLATFLLLSTAHAFPAALSLVPHLRAPSKGGVVSPVDAQRERQGEPAAIAVALPLAVKSIKFKELITPITEVRVVGLMERCAKIVEAAPSKDCTLSTMSVAMTSYCCCWCCSCPRMDSMVGGQLVTATITKSPAHVRVQLPQQAQALSKHTLLHFSQNISRQRGFPFFSSLQMTGTEIHHRTTPRSSSTTLYKSPSSIPPQLYLNTTTSFRQDWASDILWSWEDLMSSDVHELQVFLP